MLQTGLPANTIGRQHIRRPRENPRPISLSCSVPAVAAFGEWSQYMKNPYPQPCSALHSTQWLFKCIFAYFLKEEATADTLKDGQEHHIITRNLNMSLPLTSEPQLQCRRAFTNNHQGKRASSISCLVPWSLLFAFFYHPSVSDWLAVPLVSSFPSSKKIS